MINNIIIGLQLIGLVLSVLIGICILVIGYWLYKVKKVLEDGIDITINDMSRIEGDIYDR